LGGAVGTVLLAFGINPDSSYWEVVPGIVMMGLSQGLTWTGMWIASATGIAHHQQGIASGISYTALQIAGALGLAILIILGNLGDRSGAELADGLRTATLIAALGILLSGLIALTFTRKHQPQPDPATTSQ
jgi:MFS family permease